MKKILFLLIFILSIYIGFAQNNKEDHKKILYVYDTIKVPYPIYVLDTMWIPKPYPFYKRDTVYVGVKHIYLQKEVLVNDTIPKIKKVPFYLETEVNDTIPKIKKVPFLVEVLVNDTIWEKKTTGIDVFDSICFSGMTKAKADSIKAETDSITINEYDRISKAEKEKLILNVKKDANSYTVSSLFPDEKKEIVCLLLWSVKDEESEEKKLIGIFNNGGSIEMPYDVNVTSVKVCSYVVKIKNQKFCYSKNVVKP